MNGVRSKMSLMQLQLSTGGNPMRSWSKHGRIYGAVSPHLRLIAVRKETNLGLDGVFAVPINKLEALNQSTDTEWRRVTPGDPSSDTVGGLEGFHQIHCLVSKCTISRFLPNI